MLRHWGRDGSKTCRSEVPLSAEVGKSVAKHYVTWDCSQLALRQRNAAKRGNYLKVLSAPAAGTREVERYDVMATVLKLHHGTSEFLLNRAALMSGT